MMLGLLTQVMHALNPTNKPVSKLYVGYNSTSIKDLITEHRMPLWRESNRLKSNHKCTVSDRLKGSLDSISHDFVGLRIKHIRGDPEASETRGRLVEA